MTNRVPGRYNRYPGTPSPSWWNASSNPWSIGAGTSEQGYGWGVPGFGQDPIEILTEYLPYLQQQTTGERGGYIPGSGTFNQWRLDQPGLVGTVGGVPNMNLRYGQGGTGDPTTGQEAQTPEEWVQGGKLFNTTRTSSWGQGDQAGTGLDYIANLFLRSDTPSGIGTPAWSAPDAYWQGLAQQIAAGTIQPTARGWQALAAKGFTPQNIGGVAPQQAQAMGAGGGAGGAGGAGAGGRSAEQNALGSIAASQAADQAARLVYQEWQMRTGDEQLAMQKAQQAWTQTFTERQQSFREQYERAGLTGTLDGQQTLAGQQQAFAQQLARAGLTGTFEGAPTQQAQQQAWMQAFQQAQADLQQRLSEAGLLGTYQGQQTLAAQQQQWAQKFQEQSLGQQGALGLLGLQSSLQGPRDWQKYWGLAASAPQGLTSALSSLAGRYTYAPGYQGTPGAATLGSRTQDLLSGGQQGAGAPAQGAGTSDGQAGNAWQWNLANWQQMSPSMQQGVLGAAEAGGAYGPDIERLLQQAAARYTGPATAGIGL